MNTSNRYRILAVLNPRDELFLGREFQLSWSARRKGLPRGFVEAEGKIHAYGSIHFKEGVRIKRLSPPPCYCGRLTFPHRKSKECLAWLDAQT